MNDQILINIANTLITVSKFSFDITVGRAQKQKKFSISLSPEEAIHVCGLEHIPYIEKNCGNKRTFKASMLRKLSKGALLFSDFEDSDKNEFTAELPKTFNPANSKPYTLEDRIKSLLQIEYLLDHAYEGEFYDWHNNPNGVRTPDNKYRVTKIRADYMLAIPTGIPNEKLYIFMYCDRNDPTRLNVFSAFPDGVNMCMGQEHPYTILSEDKINKKTKQKNNLYTYPNLDGGNITKMSFSNFINSGYNLSLGDTTVLTASSQPTFSHNPRFGERLGDGIITLFNRIAKFFEERTPKNTDRIKALESKLAERDEQLAQKDEIIKELHSEKKDLTLELIEQKRLFREATHKTLDEKFTEAKQRCQDRKTEKPPLSPESPKGTHRR